MTFESEGLLIVAIYIWLPPASYVVFLTTLVFIVLALYIFYTFSLSPQLLNCWMDLNETQQECCTPSLQMHEGS